MSSLGDSLYLRSIAASLLLQQEQPSTKTRRRLEKVARDAFKVAERYSVQPTEEPSR